MRVRQQALATIALLALSCRSDVRIRLLAPAPAPRTDAGTSPRDANAAAGSGAGGVGGAAGVGGRRAPGTGGRDSGAAGNQGNDAGAVRDDAGAEPHALDALILRYDFSSTGTRVADRVGSADARLIGGAMLDGQGGVLLDGKDDYVDLPNRVVSDLTSASFVVWLQWEGGICWQRIFDFGANDAGEDAVGSATSALFLTASSCAANQLMVRAEFKSSEHVLHADGPLPDGRPVQVALVLDAEHDTFALYVDGQQIAESRAGFELREIDDVNNWLGRSQWVQDHNLHGRYDEFRIYAAALSARDIAALYMRGPDLP